MNSYFVGTLVRVSFQFYDADTAKPVTPGIVVAKVIDPNGVTTTPSVSLVQNPATGGKKNFQPGPLYTFTVSIDVAGGTYNYRVLGDDPYQAAKEGAFMSNQSLFS